MSKMKTLLVDPPLGDLNELERIQGNQDLAPTVQIDVSGLQVIIPNAQHDTVIINQDSDGDFDIQVGEARVRTDFHAKTKRT